MEKKITKEQLEEIADSIGEFCHTYYKGCQKVENGSVIDWNEWEYIYSTEVVCMLNSKEGLKFLEVLLSKLKE
ncbi:MAG TPA: hypothetical protein PKH06_03565 [Candidatus Dojkabacteria bacterium]|nr:hypothetical protein [Candidatus Dojkabacteria bacterium]